MAGEERPALFDSTVAVNPRARHRIGAIFVYGTLMVGERLHGHMHAHGSPGAPVPATTMGKLVDYGVYPGLIPTPGGLGLVKGELFRPEDVPELLPALDEVEGFAGHGSPGSLFRRVLLEVEAAGVIQAAWGYRSLVLGGSEVPSGDWRAR